jgi:hypothetical protein
LHVGANSCMLVQIVSLYPQTRNFTVHIFAYLCKTNRTKRFLSSACLVNLFWRLTRRFTCFKYCYYAFVLPMPDKTLDVVRIFLMNTNSCVAWFCTHLLLRQIIHAILIWSFSHVYGTINICQEFWRRQTIGKKSSKTNIKYDTLIYIYIINIYIYIYIYIYITWALLVRRNCLTSSWNYFNFVRGVFVQIIKAERILPLTKISYDHHRMNSNGKNSIFFFFFF